MGKYYFSKILLGCSIFLGMIIFGFFVQKTYASPIKAGVLDIDYDGSPGPLFNASNIAPGYSETKTLQVVNNGKKAHSFSIAVSGELGSLADVLRIKPTISGQLAPVWDKSIREISQYSNQSVVIVGSILPSGTLFINVEAYLPQSVGNEYQGTTTLSFSFVVGNESDDEAEGEETIVRTTENTTTRRASGSSGFGLLSSEGTTDVSEVEKEDAQSPEVLGESNPNDTKGAKAEKDSLCFWWWVLSLILALFLVFWGYLNKKREIIFSWFWPVFVVTILYFLHWGLHQWYKPSKYCDYFILIELALLATYFIITNYIKEEETEDSTE